MFKISIDKRLNIDSNNSENIGKNNYKTTMILLKLIS
jgi:hypothetical protein